MSNPNERAAWSYTDHHRFHLRRGTRPAGLPKPWRESDFAEKARIGRTAANKIKNGRAIPRRDTLASILDTFFGSNPDLLHFREEILDAWIVADSSRYRPKVALPPVKLLFENHPGLFSSYEHILPLVECATADQVAEFLARTSFDVDTANRIEHVIGSPDVSDRLLDLVAEVCQFGLRHPDEVRAASVAANLLSRNSSWKPADRDSRRLTDVCHDLLREQRADQIAIVEALAFALSRAGNDQALAASISRMLADSAWGDHDFSRLGSYYKGEGNIFTAMKRHHVDPARNGLMAANNAHRLMRLAHTMPRKVSFEKQLKPMLMTAASALWSNGLSAAAEDVRKQAG